MNLTDLAQEVYNLTNRPDLVNETKTALKSATLKMHQADFWDKDIFETGISFNVLDYYQQFEYLLLIPNYRAIKYFRPTDANANGIGCYTKGFKIVKTNELVDSYNQLKKDVCYLAGQVINFRSSVQFQYMLAGFYVNPIVTDSGYSSWIANELPYAIIFEACRIVFKAIGSDAESTAYQSLVAEQVALIRTANILAKGE